MFLQEATLKVVISWETTLLHVSIQKTFHKTLSYTRLSTGSYTYGTFMRT